MISIFRVPCPLDGSELVCTSGWYDRAPKPDIEWGYCPRCDAAFQLWNEPALGKQTIFTWKRKGKDLVLVDEDQARAQEFRKYDWELQKANMLDCVRWFLQERFGKKQCCPNDGGDIPLVAEFPYETGATVRFYWCVYCGCWLWAYLMDKDYGWQCVASFSFDKKKGRFVLRENRAGAANIDLIIERAATLSKFGYSDARP